MGRLIDADVLIDELKESAFHHCNNPREDSLLQRDRVIVREQPTVEAIPKEEVRQFIENIQRIKDNHNEHGEPINYGTICGILIEGYRLLDKYKESKDGEIDCN